MVPVLDAVKAEIVRGGSGKTDYRYRWWMLSCSCPMLPMVLSLMVSFTPYRWPYIGPSVVHRLVVYS